MKKIRHHIEATIIKTFILFISLFSFSTSSLIGKYLSKFFAKFSKKNSIARKNIKIVFPNISNKEINILIEKMWENIGRSIGEFIHINKLSKQEYFKRVEVIGQENFNCFAKNGGLILTAHIGNWEIVPYFLQQLNYKICIIYRKSNNPLIDQIINQYRYIDNITFIPKGKSGAKQIIKEIKNKSVIVFLNDQKMWDGIKVPFFNKDCMTAPAIANLALTYNLPIVPGHCIRYKSDKFKIIIDKPIKLKKTGNKSLDVYNVTARLNKIIEEWIRLNADQWFWIHNRWQMRKNG